MAAGRSRNSPCFCGSGRKLKHCCGRQLTTVRTWKSAEGSCRWRFWQPHGGHERFAGEVAEHICDGERVWIARGTPYGTSWLIGEEPATLMEVLEHLPGAHYHWVIEQTMTAVGDAVPNDDASALSADPDPEETLVLGEIHRLTLEVLSLAHASDALDAHLPTNLRASHPAALTFRDRAFTQIAS